jgi:hypothetical protein
MNELARLSESGVTINNDRPENPSLRDTQTGQGVLQIIIGPIKYHVAYAPGARVSMGEEPLLVAEAILRNTHRILDKTGKYDIPLRDIF